jgi:anaerobic magnesium-protoporphyrin IX monomethyl ester cyclase
MSQADVLLMMPPGIRSNTPPLGLLYLAAQLEKDQVRIRVVDAGMEKLSLDATLDRIREIGAQIVGLGATTPEIQVVEDFAAVIKAALPHVAVVLGGPHPTLDPEGVLAQPQVDYVIRGEGEFSFSEFCREYLGGRRDGFTTLGLSYKVDGKQVHLADRPLIENLDDAPMPARHLLPMSLYRNYGRVYKRRPVQVMINSRGCPFRCIFCAHGIFGHSYRFNSAARMTEEVKILMRDYGAREILFREDNFTADKKRVYEFCDLIHKENLDLSWMALSHVNSIDADICKAMAEAGCWHLGMGVESGSPEIQRILKKNLNLDRALQSFDIVQKAGLRTLAFFMIGNYGDSAETIQQTIDFAGRLNTDFAIFTITTPFPKTELFEMAVKEGLITNFDPSKLCNNPAIFKQKHPILRTPHLSAEELEKWQRKAIMRFYLRPKQILRILGNLSLARALLHIQPSDYSNDATILAELRSRAEALAAGGTPAAKPSAA